MKNLKIVDKVLDIPRVDLAGGNLLMGAYNLNDGTQLSSHALLYRAGTLEMAHSEPCSPINVRINSACFSGDILGDRRCDCSWQLEEAINRISEDGGILIYHLNHEGKGWGLVHKFALYRSALERFGEAFTPGNLPGHQDLRSFEEAAVILMDLGIRTVSLFSKNSRKLAALSDAGISVNFG